MSVTPQTQRVNCTKPTREKAKRLVVETINQQSAHVIGDNDTYLVTFSDLTCNCRGGTFGLRCSHCLAALRERAILRGFSHCAFLPTQQLADAFASMQRGLGRRAICRVEGRYFYTEFDTTDEVELPPDSAVIEVLELRRIAPSAEDQRTTRIAPSAEDLLAARMREGELALAGRNVKRATVEDLY